jgi:hypothetical protein
MPATEKACMAPALHGVRSLLAVLFHMFANVYNAFNSLQIKAKKSCGDVINEYDLEPVQLWLLF